MKIYLMCLLIAVSNCKLIYGFGFLRHGTLYPKKDFIAANLTAKFNAQLTPVGMRQLYNLGMFLREDYVIKQKYLPQHFDYKIEFLSSSLQRTQLSAYSFIYGLYPLKQGPKLKSNISKQILDPPYATFSSKKLRTQPRKLKGLQYALKQGFHPIPVTFKDEILDSCKNYDPLFAQKMKEIQNQRMDFEKENQIFIKRMKLLFSLPHSNNDIQQLADLYRAVEADRQIGISIPKDYDEQDDKRLKYFYEFFSSLKVQGKFGRLLITLSYQYMVDKLSAAANGTSNLKMTFIVCHSSTFWPVMVHLNLTSSKCITERFNHTLEPSQNCGVPYYGSSLIFQLHQDDQTHALFVKIKLDGNYMKMCASDSDQCPLQDFLQRVKNNIQKDYDSLCGPRPGKGFITSKL